MPKLACPCGFIHDLSPIPDEGWRVIRDKDMEAYIQHKRVYPDGFHAPEGSGDRGASDAAGREIVRMSTLLYDCPTCGRIMWRRKRDGEFQIYAPEDPRT